MSTVEQTRISIMDTTLRDGEQTPDIAYTASEKLHVARMLSLVYHSTPRPTIEPTLLPAAALGGGSSNL